MCHITENYVGNDQNNYYNILNSKYNKLFQNNHVNVKEELKYEVEDAVEYDDDDDVNAALIKKKTNMQNIGNIEAYNKKRLGNVMFNKIRKLISKEDREKGEINRAAIMEYISGMNGILCIILIIVIYIIFEYVFFGFDYFINIWAATNEINEIYISVPIFFSILLLFIVVMFILDLSRGILLFYL
eukprot:529596_1